MSNSIKVWAITYKHPTTGEVVEGIEYATTKQQATKLAMLHNVPVEDGGFFWEIESVEEKEVTT